MINSLQENRRAFPCGPRRKRPKSLSRRLSAEAEVENSEWRIAGRVEEVIPPFPTRYSLFPIRFRTAACPGRAGGDGSPPVAA